MKQVLQDIRSVEIAVHEVPAPGPAEGFALVAVRHSLISAGTEHALKAPVPVAEQLLVAEASLPLVESARDGSSVRVGNA